MKKIVIMMVLCLSLSLSSIVQASSADISCSEYIGQNKIWWNGIELKTGQIGRLSIIQNTTLYKLDGDKKIFERTLKKGEFYRIYAFKPGKLSVGGGYYVDRDSNIKYETPSKAKLKAVNCIKQLKTDPTRGIPADTSYEYVKSVETAQLIEDFHSEDVSVLRYYLPDKYDTSLQLSYYFEKDILQFIVYDFMPEKNSYDDYYRMGAIFYYHLSEIEKELGINDSNWNDDYSSYTAKWSKDGWEGYFIVDDKKIYTSAQLTILVK